MARTWGAWSATSSSGARYRVGIDYTVSGTKVTVNGYYFQSAYSIYKSVTLTRTGKLSGSYSVRVDTAGGTVSLGRGGTVTGSRGGSVTIGGRVTNILHGLTCSVSVKVNIPAAPPSKPGKPSVSSATTTTYKASVGAPASNGAAITSYQWDMGGGSTKTTTGRTVTITGRNPNANHHVRVRARNSAGWGPWSAWSNYIKTKANKPATPKWGSTSKPADLSVTGTWSGSWPSSAPVSSFEVQMWRSSTGTWATVAGSLSSGTRSYTRSGLAVNELVRLRVRAKGPGGTSGWATGGTVANTPGAPTGVSAKKVGSNIEVTWTDVSKHYDDASATRPRTFTVQDSPNGGAWTTVGTVTSPTTKFVHSNPDPAKTHRYRVRSQVSSGGRNMNSAFSATSNTVQLQAPPLAPTLRPVTSSTSQPGDDTDRVDTEGTLRFELVHNSVDTSDQTNAQVRYREVGTSSWTTVSRTTQDYYERSALSEGTYEWQVRTRGDHPTYGPWSSSRTFKVAERHVTSIIEPDTPVIDTSKVSLYWDNTPGGFAQADSEVELWQGDTLLASARPGVFQYWTPLERLANQTEYTLRVRSKSPAGLWSEWAEVDFETDFPTPRCFVPELSWDPETGAVGLTPEPLEPVREFRWTGARSDSPSEALEDGEVVATNLYPNPSFEAPGIETVLAYNLAAAPYPPNYPAVWSTGPYWYGLRMQETDPPEGVPYGTWVLDVVGDGGYQGDLATYVSNIGSGRNVKSQVEAGVEYTVALWVRNEYLFEVLGKLQAVNEGATIDLVEHSHSAEDEWVRFVGTFTAETTGAVYFTYTATLTGGQPPPYNYSTRLTGLSLVEGGEPGEYMTGDTLPGSLEGTALVPEWDGDAENSPSRVTYVQAPVAGTVSALAELSEEWAASGKQSAEVVSTTATEGGARVILDSPTLDMLGLDTGVTYTASVEARMGEAWTGGGPSARSLRFSSDASSVVSQHTGRVGQERLSITFTVPDAVEYAWLGMPSSSPSTKSVNGSVIATNHFENPYLAGRNSGNKFTGVIQQGAGVAPSSAWSARGSESARLGSLAEEAPPSTSKLHDSSLVLVSEQSGLPAGQYYASVTARIDPAEYAASEWNWGYGLVFVSEGPGSPVSGRMYTQADADEEGVVTLYLTFTVPPDDAWYLTLNGAGSEDEAPMYVDRILILDRDVEDRAYFDGDMDPGGDWELALVHGGAAGTPSVFFDDLIITEGTEQVRYFDGDRLNTVDADYLSYERSINGGPWELVAENLDPQVAIVDPLPDVGGVNCYRITSWTELPSSASCEARCLVLYDGTQECPDLDSILAGVDGTVVGDPIPVIAAYVNAGDAYVKVCRAEIELQADDADVGIAQRVLHQFSGRSYPTEFSGQALSHQVDLTFDAPANEWVLPGSGLSTVGDWFDMARLPGPHFYRDPWGRHWQASISTTPARREGTKVRAMGFTVTRVDEEPFMLAAGDDEDEEG